LEKMLRAFFVCIQTDADRPNSITKEAWA
jgi:hypothetical protein